MTNFGGFDDNNRYSGPSSPAYGEIPPLPRDGYGVSDSGQPTYSAPTESVPGQPQHMPPPMPPQFGPPGAYGPHPYGYTQHPGTNGMAIAALVTTLAGGFFACGIGFLVGPILGMVALGQIKQSGESGRGMAIAGIVVGAIGLLLVVAYVVFLVAVATSASSSY